MSLVIVGSALRMPAGSVPALLTMALTVAVSCLQIASPFFARSALDSGPELPQPAVASATTAAAVQHALRSIFPLLAIRLAHRRLYLPVRARATDHATAQPSVPYAPRYQISGSPSEATPIARTAPIAIS